MSERTKRGRGIGAKIALILIIYTTALLGVALVAVGFILNRDIGVMILENGSQAVDARASELGEKLEKFRSQLKLLTESPQLLSKDRRLHKAFVEEYRNQLSSELTGLFVAWPDGSAYSWENPSFDVSDRPYFKTIMAKRSDWEVSDPLVSKNLGVPVIVMAMPVKTEDGSVVALVGVQAKLEVLSSLMSGIKLGSSGYGWLVTSEGRVIAHPVAERVMNLVITESDKEGFRGLAGLGAAMASSTSGTGTWSDPSGVKYTTWYSAVKNSSWILAIDQKSSEAERSLRSIILVLAILLALGAAVTVLISLVISRSIAKPINLAASGFRELAEGEADLSACIDMDRSDEIGDLVTDFNTFLCKLRDTIAELKGSQADLFGIGEELGKSVEGATGAVAQLTGNIGVVRERGEHQASSVEQSSSAVSQIARNIASLDDLIASQAASITEASAAIEEMVGNIHAVTGSVAKMASEFSTLSEASETGKATLAKAAERVAQISGQSRSLLEANEVIAAIASSTNLLAMNAAIEAAHAGEAGKGFSVVADEIRRLSETASEQSKTIGRELTLILEAITDIVEASKESEMAFSLVAGKIGDTESIVKEVNHAMIEQGEGSKQILEALRGMNDITSQVKTGSSEMSEGNQAVLEEMSRLRDASFDVKERVDGMADSAEHFEAILTIVAAMARGTRDTIQRMDAAIGRFKV